jgi:hypothetical protein
MRPSSAASVRASHLPQGASSASNAKLIEKKKEYEAISALDKTVQLLRERIDGLQEDCDVMAKAGEGMVTRAAASYICADDAKVFGDVLDQWPKMFHILNLFCEYGC